MYVVTCECGTEYDLDYSEDRNGEIVAYAACPDCGIQLDSVTVAEAVNESHDEGR